MPVFTNYPTTQPMQLSDMLGDLSTLQQYKQQQQLMPIQLEKAQLEIQKQRANTPLEMEQKALELNRLRETNPSEIARLQSLSKQQLGTEQPTITSAQEAAKQSQTKSLSDVFAYDKDYNNQIKQILGGFVNDKGLKGNPSEVLRVLKDAENEVKLLTKSDPEHELKTEARFAPLKALVVSGKHPNVEQALKNIIQTGITPTSQQTLQTPVLATVGGAPATFTSGSGVATPLTIGDQTPQNPQGGAQGQGGIFPLGMNLPPAPLGASQLLQGVTPTQMSLPYPVRRAGDIRPLAPNETKDTEANFTYRNNLSNGQLNLSKSKRNLDDVIKDAGQIKKEDFFSSGWAGTATRNLKSIAGDPKYKELSKAIASVQISNLQAQGADMSSDAGKSLQRLSTGDETYPPDILIGVARKTYAEVQNLDMQANGAAKFAQKYGDNNLSAFKRMWSANADNKVFEAMTIFDNVSNKEERNKAINELLGSNPQARQQFYNKYNNIKKLTETGEL
jgi:hypothetical protein